MGAGEPCPRRSEPRSVVRRVLTVFGTRPEAIKLAPVVMELRRFPADVGSVVCVTAQHRQMLDQVNDLFGIRPDIDLDLMTENQSLEALTASVIRRVSLVLREVAPDLVLVQGDTTTVMATAMACFYQKIAVGHVEAGLRTSDIYDPYPEEMNRRVTSVLARYHFAPTERAQRALLAEGHAPETVVLTGNTVVDALQHILARSEPADLPYGLNGHRMILVTAHRRENFGQPLENICQALLDLTRLHADVEVVYPVHLNPNVRRIAYGMLEHQPRIHLLEPVDYLQLAHLLSRCYMVLTDSGGIQEEAPVVGKPVLVMRRETERPEAVEAGTARLVGTDRQAIVAESERLLDDPNAYEAMAHAQSPFGDGRAAERIVAFIRGLRA
jgi:UDP-N-acetylglucosamine 2-epimerase